MRAAWRGGFCLSLLLTTIAWTLSSATAGSEEAATWKGKTVYVDIGFGAGGGYDVYGRLLAAHFGKHLPGNPVVVPRNMPGAGGLKLLNYLASVAPKDGTEIGVFASSSAMEPVMGNEQAKYDPLAFSWIGSMDQDVAYCGLWQSPGAPSTFRDLLTREATFGDSGPGAISQQHPLILKNVLGAKIRSISGYQGSRSVQLAMERGEVNGACGMVSSAIKAQWINFVTSGQMKLIIQMGPKKSEEFGDIPSVYDFVKNDEDRKVLDVHFKQILLARPVAAPPGLSPAVIAAMRKAFDATIADPAFLAQAEQLNVSINPTNGADAQALMAELMHYPPAVIEKAKAAIQR
jgi:tripartite-type tricarboxylate transporter receptor subunit TctC